MKNIIKYFCLFALIISVVSCGDEAEWPVSDIEFVPALKISEIVGNSHPFKLEFYDEKPLIILFPTPVKAIAYENLSFSDNSTEMDFDITVTGLIKTKKDDLEEGKEIEIIVTGSKELVEVQDRNDNDNLLSDDNDPPQPIMVMRHNGTLTINYKDKDGNIESSDVFSEFLVEDTQIYN